MATELAIRPGTSPEAGDGLRRWLSYHVFYHADRNLLLRSCMWPLISELASQGIIDHFYFVRYSLGGPHLRVRWRLKNADLAQAAEERMEERLAAFFKENPSSNSMNSEETLAMNRAIAGRDQTPGEEVERVHSDCSWLPFARQFEIERYGGDRKIESSLSLFCLSSLSVLKLLNERAAPPRQGFMADMLRCTLQLAWGMAHDEEEFDKLLAYGSVHWGRYFTYAVQQGNIAFHRQNRKLLSLVSAALEAIVSGSTYRWPSLVEGAALLACEVAELAPQTRWAIASSHIHMTANRLGLLNSEEAYVSRILVLAVQTLKRETPDVWLNVWQRRPAMLAQVPGRLLDVVATSVLEEQCRANHATFK